MSATRNGCYKDWFLYPRFVTIVEKFLYQPIPAELWHYTSVEGFEGMVSSGTIWATEVRSSRDKTEFIHARQIAEHYLSCLGPADEHTALGIKAATDLVTEQFETGWSSQHKTEVFIACFSSAPDRKSQWVDYSRGGQGVAVVMDLRNIRPPLHLGSAVTVAPCVYQQSEKEHLVASALNHVIENVRDGYRKADSLVWAGQMLKDWQRIDRIFNEKFDRAGLQLKLRKGFEVELQSASARLSVDLLRLASHCKHHGYFEEFEWRLALPHTNGQPFEFTKVEYRGPGRIPYVAHRISGKEKLPIVRVVTGFACRQAERIAVILEQNGYSVPVEQSEIPEVR